MSRYQVHLITSLLFISFIFLIMQIYFMKFTTSENDDLGHTLKRSNLASSVDVSGHQKFTDSHSTVKSFLATAASYNLPVFLIEPSVLLKIAETQKVFDNTVKTRNTQCKYLCHDRPLTTFAIVDKHWSVQKQFFYAVEKNGFSWTHTSGEDPRLLSINGLRTKDVSLHYLFYNLKHLIHLVILYERNNNYWWHGPLTIHETLKSSINMTRLNATDFVIGHHAGAYDKMEIASIRLDSLKLYTPKYPAVFLQQLPNSKFIECNYKRAKAFTKKNGVDNSDTTKEFQMKAKRILTQGKELLDQIGVRFWLSSGTCLGWFRECGVIGHSQDVDFGIWIKDYQNRIIPTFNRYGLNLKHLFGKVEDSFELSFLSGDTKLDMFFFYEEDEIMWNGGTQASTGKKFKYTFPQFTLCWTEFLGLKVRVPCETQSYIEANYGKDWNKRVYEWDWKSSPPNVRENGQWPEEEWSEVIQVW
ncbi:ribitol-5-phosphate transferase FKTN-like [Glandiceps talaboti]